MYTTCRDIRVGPERISGLTSLNVPETADGLMKFVYAANWIRTSLPEYPKVTAPLQEKLDKALKLTKRTKRVAKGIDLTWSPDERKAYEDVKHS